MNKLSVGVILLLLVGCNRQPADEFYGDIAPMEESSYEYAIDVQEEESFNSAAKEEYAAYMQVSNTVDQGKNQDQKPTSQIIKTVHLSLEVDQLDSVELQVQSLIPRYQSILVGSTRFNHSGGTEITMTIRVPAPSLDPMVGDLELMAKRIRNKETTTKDVGEEFVDLQTRLENKRVAEQRYREILTQASTVEEILKVEEHLRKIREEIEAKQGRLRYLQNQVRYSTIHLVCTQPDYLPAQNGPSYGTRVKKALSGGWEFMETASIALVLLWPLWILGVLLWLLFRYRSKLRQKSM